MSLIAGSSVSSNVQGGGNGPSAVCYAAEGEPATTLDQAIQALRRDPTHPVRARVDEGLTVELRAVEAVESPKRSAADVLREIGRWEAETGDELEALFVRQRSSRQVPDPP